MPWAECVTELKGNRTRKSNEVGKLNGVPKKGEGGNVMCKGPMGWKR